MLDRLSQRLPKPRTHADNRTAEPGPRAGGTDIVMITGTTGALGSAVLAELIACEQVSRVYALERGSPDGMELRRRQEDSLKRRNLHPGILASPKVVSVEADFTVSGLGVDVGVYREVRGHYQRTIYI